MRRSATTTSMAAAGVLALLALPAGCASGSSERGGPAENPEPAETTRKDGGQEGGRDREQDRAFREQRRLMVRSQIEARGIRDRAVLRALEAVPRERFVPAAERPNAYADRPLPIGEQQTISQPYIVALMSSLARLRPGQRVLEIGTGSGYQAAILAEIGVEVWSIELLPGLAARAETALRAAGYDGIHLRVGDGYRGWPEAAPFDRIVVTAAPPEIPKALLDQLAPGGRLVAPVGSDPWNQRLVVASRSAAGEIEFTDHGGVAFVPMVPGKR